MVNLLGLNEGLGVAQKDEKMGLGQMLERETKREKNLELAARERRMKMQKQAKEREQPLSSPAELLAEIERKYWAAFEVEKAKLEAKMVSQRQ